MTGEAPAGESPAISAVLCLDTEAMDRLGPLLRYLAVGLVDQAVDVRILSPDPRIDGLALGPVQSLVHRPLGWPFAARRVEKVLDGLAQRAPTVVHAVSAGGLKLASSIAGAFDADLVLSVTSLADCHELVRHSAEDVDAFVACTAPLAALLEERLRIPEDQVALIRWGAPARGERACFATPERTPAILCTAPLSRRAGVAAVLDAARLLREKNLEFLLFLWGHGPDERAFRRQVREQKLTSLVMFADPLGDPAQAMPEVDLFLNPTAAGSFSAAPLQAMAAGVAVVACADAVCDHVIAGKTAMVCDQPTPQVFAEAIAALLTDREQTQRLADAAREHVRNNHSVSAMAEHTAALYRRLALAHATFPLEAH
ncbi:MAG: glycosyltransferase family 4 protein [Planctomycetes bacterium]|nr:glycosyltransferase family 4 protein [Planctomycetota bacterium]